MRMQTTFCYISSSVGHFRVVVALQRHSVSQKRLAKHAFVFVFVFVFVFLAFVRTKFCFVRTKVSQISIV